MMTIRKKKGGEIIMSTKKAVLTIAGIAILAALYIAAKSLGL